MPWFWTLLIFLCFTFNGNYNNLSEAKKHQKLSPAVVVGTVYCDTCFSQDFPKASHFIPGASVEVECKDSGSTRSFRRQAKTDNNGQFKIDLPFSVSKQVKRIDNCRIQLVESSQRHCSVAAAAKSSALHLKSRTEGVHVFSAGLFSFKPSNQPDVCDRRPSANKKSTSFLFEKDLSPIANPNDPTFLPPIHDPPSDGSNLPDLGRYLPKLPPLPQLPSLPGIPLLPPKDEKVTTNLPMAFPFPPFNPIPNPFQPPPSIVPPIFPTPPPSLFPPLFPAPPFNLPPVPGLFPSPPPPPPAFPIPLPPFPFITAPVFPGVPPANRKSSEPKTKGVTP